MMQKKWIAFLLSIILLVSFTGCSKSKQIEDDFGSDSANNESQCDILASIGMNPDEKLTMTPKTAEGNVFYEVNADVIVPENGKVSLVEADVKQHSIAEVNEYAKLLFDDGKYEQVKPLSCYSKEELSKRKDEVLKELKNKDAENYHALKAEYIDISALLSGLFEFQPTEYHEGDLSYVADFIFFPEGSDCDNFNQKDIKNYILKGNVDGKEYVIVAYQYKGESFLRVSVYEASEGYPDIYPGCAGDGAGILDNVIVCKKTGANGWSDEDVDELRKEGKLYISNQYDGESYSNNAAQENICQYSEEEAGRLALAFMNKLNPKATFAIQNTTYRNIPHIDVFAFRELEETVPEKRDNVQDGYSFTIVQSVNGILQEDGFMQPFSEVSKKLEERSWVEYASMSYTVEVSDKGVESVSLGTWNVVPKETMSEDVELLSMKELSAIIEEQLVISDELAIARLKQNEEWGGPTYENGSMKDVISKMELQMVMVNYDGKYTSCPAWNLKKKTPYQNDVLILSIHAVDGSVLYRNDTDPNKDE